MLQIKWERKEKKNISLNLLQVASTSTSTTIPLDAHKNAAMTWYIIVAILLCEALSLFLSLCITFTFRNRYRAYFYFSALELKVCFHFAFPSSLLTLKIKKWKSLKSSFYRQTLNAFFVYFPSVIATLKSSKVIKIINAINNYHFLFILTMFLCNCDGQFNHCSY